VKLPTKLADDELDGTDDIEEELVEDDEPGEGVEDDELGGGGGCGSSVVQFGTICAVPALTNSIQSERDICKQIVVPSKNVVSQKTI